MATNRLNILRRSTRPRGRVNPWLCFTAEQANSTVRLDITGSPNPVSLETSSDGKTWTAYTWDGSTGATITLANVGDKVYWRNTVTDDSGILSSSQDNYYCFVMTGRIAGDGNIQSLLKKDCSLYTLSNYCFFHLFRGCASLVSAPILPATSLANNCYQQMFFGCTSLISAPTLSVTTLANYCYYQMFRGCTSLISAPELPATTLATGSYRQMFYGCTSLTSAPELPATTLTNQCYSQMFSYCASLSSVKTNLLQWRDDLTATTDWLYNVAELGTFYCPDGLDDGTRDASHIPVDWNVIKPSDGYVQSGLIFQLDIKRNIEAGEYGSSTWTDVKQGKQFTEDFPEYVGDLLEYATANGYTVEIVIGCEYNSQDDYYHGVGWFITEPEGYVDASIDLGAIIIEGFIMPDFDAKINGHRVQFYQDGTDYSVVTLSNYSLSDKVYINNVEYTGTAYSRTVGTDPKTRVGNPDYIKEVRIYNRALTSEERLHNYQLDQERFNV